MKPFILLTAILFSSFSFAQDLEQKLNKPPVTCLNVAYHSSLHFINHLEQNQFDSAQIILDYWEKRCGWNEPIYRANVLITLLQQDAINEALILKSDPFVIDYVDRAFISYHDMGYYYDRNPGKFGYVPLGTEFDTYTERKFQSLKDTFPQNSFERFLCETYGGESELAFQKLRSKALKTSHLGKVYHAKVIDQLDRPEFHAALIHGYWIPTDELEELGIHPVLGIQFGYRKKRININGKFYASLTNAPDKYLARNKPVTDTLSYTNQFNNIYVGVEFGYSLIQYKRHELQLTAGIGYDRIETFKNEDKDDIDPAYASTFNTNLGLGYRVYLDPKIYTGMYGHFNLVDYTRSEVLEMKGNTYMIGLQLGFSLGYHKLYQLDKLKYPYRK